LSDAAVLRLKRAKELAKWLNEVKGGSRAEIDAHMFLVNGLKPTPVTVLLKQMAASGLIRLHGYRWVLTIQGKLWALT